MEREIQQISKLINIIISTGKKRHKENKGDVKQSGKKELHSNVWSEKAFVKK